MKKKRQHYIWRNYLRTWTVNDIIWCCCKGKIFKSNLKGIGQSKYFYKLKNLSNTDIDMIYKLAIEQSQPHLQRLNKGWISTFKIVYHLKNLIEANGINDPELDKLLDDAIHNLEEDLHSGIEADTIKYIDSILNEDVGFYHDDEACMDFIYYICVQYMRTRKAKESVVASLRKFQFIEIEKIWNVLSHIYATNIGWSIYAARQRFKMVLLKNNSILDLITGDQPVINTYSYGLATNEIPEKLEFYYPVSPKLAILITERKEYANVNGYLLSEKEVSKYNDMIVEQSHSQLYAASEKVLRQYV